MASRNPPVDVEELQSVGLRSHNFYLEYWMRQQMMRWAQEWLEANAPHVPTPKVTFGPTEGKDSAS